MKNDTNENQLLPKPIPRPVHAVVDYVYAAAFAAAPEMLGYEREDAAKTLSRVAAVGVALVSLCTRYELGAIPILPFKAHLAADVAVGLFTAGAPFLFGFADNKRARNFFVGMGAFSVAAGLLTEPTEMEEDERR